VRIIFTENGWEDYLFWQAHDPSMLKKTNELIRDVCRTPYIGLGKPEPLKGDLSGWWSRRIHKTHRLVYAVEGTRGKDQRLIILQCRMHY